VGITVGVYERMLGADLLRSAGPAVGGAIAARRPDLVEEVEGIAAGARVSPDVLLAVNARTELLGGNGAGECSVVGSLLPGGGVRLAQNWDWHPDLAPARVVWTVEDGDRRFTTVTEAGMLAKVGVSGAGLAVALNFLTSTADGGVGGVPIHVLLRCVLDSCGSLLEALTLLVQAPVTASSCVTVAGVEDAGAELVAIELSPLGPGVLWPAPDGRLLHTNHFLAPPPGLVDTQPVEHPSSLLRLRRLLGSAGLGDHFGAPESVCRHAEDGDAWADRRATLLSVQMEPGTPALRVAAGAPCDAAYEDVPL
jgi:isopenicillin-N N-acyltransferase-like protein